MRVLLVTNYPGSFPYIDELGYWLNKKGLEVELMDLPNLVHYKYGDGKFQQASYILQGVARRIALLPKLGKLARKPFLQNWLSRFKDHYDVINLHYSDLYYTDYIKQLLPLGERFVPVIWGSDFYRVNSNEREKQRKLYNPASAIILGNPGVAQEFYKFYNDYQQKGRVVGFGIAKLELLKTLLQTETKQSIRREFDIPEGLICVVCGYNGSVEQQHEWILKELGKAPHHIKSRIHILLPLTYGANKARIEILRTRVKETGVSYSILEGFMNDVQTAKLRIVTDVVVNAQTSDSLSASLQEHMYAGNVLLAADWLPYNVFEDLGIRMSRFSKSNFLANFTEVINKYQDFASEMVGNAEKIYRFSAWENRIDQWVTVFKEDKII